MSKLYQSRLEQRPAARSGVDRTRRLQPGHGARWALNLVVAFTIGVVSGCPTVAHGGLALTSEVATFDPAADVPRGEIPSGRFSANELHSLYLVAFDEDNPLCVSGWNVRFNGWAVGDPSFFVAAVTLYPEGETLTIGSFPELAVAMNSSLSAPPGGYITLARIDFVFTDAFESGAIRFSAAAGTATPIVLDCDGRQRGTYQSGFLVLNAADYADGDEHLAGVTWVPPSGDLGLPYGAAQYELIVGTATVSSVQPKVAAWNKSLAYQSELSLNFHQVYLGQSTSNLVVRSSAWLEAAPPVGGNDEIASRGSFVVAAENVLVAAYRMIGPFARQFSAVYDPPWQLARVWHLDDGLDDMGQSLLVQRSVEYIAPLRVADPSAPGDVNLLRLELQPTPLTLADAVAELSAHREAGH